MAKGPEAFRSISEASDELGVPQHVLRFWETRFSFIRPMKRAGGRRFYRKQDLDVLRGVRALLHGGGRAIKDVQRLHREEGVARVVAAGLAAAAAAPAVVAAAEAVAVAPPPRPAAVSESSARQRLQRVLGDLERVKSAVDRLLDPSRERRLPASEAPPIRPVP